MATLQVHYSFDRVQLLSFFMFDNLDFASNHAFPSSESGCYIGVISINNPKVCPSVFR